MKFIALGLTAFDPDRAWRRRRDQRCGRQDQIESIEPLPGGTFVAVVRWSMGGFRRPNGTMRPPGKDRMSLVLVPRGDAIAHGANVPIDEVAEAHNPIKR
jgi:hypothetical protein